MMGSEEEMERTTALITMIGRTGAKSTKIQFCEEERPTVWMAVAAYPIEGSDDEIFIAAGDLSPLSAVFCLVEKLVDGGTCQTCRKPTGIVMDIDEMPLGSVVCWYQYDPELKSIRRGCE
jgi:hypothetical protein